MGITIAASEADRTSQRSYLRDVMKKTKQAKPPSDEYARFEQLAKQLISVPKSEIDKREAEYQKKKAAKKKQAA